MLHVDSDADPNIAIVPQGSSNPSPAAEPKIEVNSMIAATEPRSGGQVLLATAAVRVRVASGRTVAVRALLDQGSEMTFISENLAQLLKAKRIRMPVSVSAVGCVHAGTYRYAAQKSPLNASEPSLTTVALILKNLTSYAPKRVADLSSFAHLKGLRWADADPTSSDSIHIIVGADLFGGLILNGLRTGGEGEPIAQNSIFGWVISGPIDSSRESSHATLHDLKVSSSSVNIAVHHCSCSSSLHEEIRKFWELEELPRKVIMAAEDERCENHFRSTHSRARDGRYIVRLPFKTGPPIDIGNSRCKAEKLLDSLRKRLRARPEHASENVNFLNKYKQLGHMCKAPVSRDAPNQHVFLPHHPVFREDSATTHLRVVFNASNVTSNGSSLNDHLLAGPKLQADLPTIILRWRQFKFVYAADIAKMYCQIQLDSRDINYQHILWQPAFANSVQEYQLLTVTYGMACAPYLALRVLQQLVTDERSRYPFAASILKNNIYIDDVLFGSDNVAPLIQARDQLINLLRRGGFKLRKWSSNLPCLLEDIDAANHGLACSKTLSIDEKLKILGIGWNPSLDVFKLTVSLADRIPERKRSILAAIAKLYDPLGWVTPVTITAKIFMQQLWRDKIEWDDIVPQSLLTRWKIIYSRLSFLNGLYLPRWTGFEQSTFHTELHGFADASNIAYAVVVYLKVIARSGEVTITLLAGKSRVAPLTPLSIPRLELSAAVHLSRLVEFVRGSLDTSTLPCFCWTDSTIVLTWLDQHPSRWKTFVANQVADVQSRLLDVKWRHVPTTDNPADCALRGLFGDEIVTHSLWWQSPSWLRKSPDEWPHCLPCTSVDAPLEEKVVAIHSHQSRTDFDLASRYSSWPKLICVAAYLFKFIAGCRRQKHVPPPQESSGLALTASEFCKARLFWIKRIQGEIFPQELLALSQNRHISAKSPILMLRPFLDQDGILRVGRRLNKAPMPLASRHPILLASHSLVHLIGNHAHKRALHAGLQLTLSTLRQDYWLIRARTICKSIIHRCITCARERAAIPSQLMGDLPTVRVSAPTRSFLHCGVDYAGPVYVRASGGRGIKSRKAYIALFICLSTRAIYLELVSDYSTPAFLNAYARFCSRRGLPQSIYSDNGTMFIGADHEMRAAYRAALHDPNFQNRTASDNVVWHFLLPSAPHFGGIWEAGVKRVKYHLRRVLGNHTLAFEEFTTLLCKVEACFNSRPIAPLSDRDDYEALTPGHFLIGSAITTNPEPSILDVNENRLTRWQLVQQMTERFWKLWSHDYVNTLQQRIKWRKVQPLIQIGQLVLLRNGMLPPSKWELGRVTQVHPGSDGLTRVVTVKTAHSEYKRPIVKLCVLPVNSVTIPTS